MRVVTERQIGELGKLVAVSKRNAVQKSGRLRNATRAAERHLRKGRNPAQLDEFLGG